MTSSPKEPQPVSAFREGNMGNRKGSVLVIGGGIAGVQASLDLADSGFFVHLLEKTTAIGEAMSKLDKTFPTNDCSACILSPKLVECGRHININLLTLSELQSLDGEPGAFRAVVRQRPRYVNVEKCIACGACAEKCPKKVQDEFNLGIGKRKAVYLKYPQAVPLKYAIDPQSCIWLRKPGRCGACAKVCPTGAINLNDTPKDHILDVGAVILAMGFRPYNPFELDFTGYGRLPNVITAMEFERLLSPSGPTMGHMERPSDKKEPRRIAWLQCIGSRAINRSRHGYCSAVCCMYAIKQAVIAREHTRDELTTGIFFMDMRTHGKGFEQYYQRAQDSGVAFHRARVHSVLPVPHSDDLLLRYVDENGEVREEVHDLVVLSVGLEQTPQTAELARRLGVGLDADGFIATEPFDPVSTNRPGLFVCGAVSGPKDIPQSVMDASAAANEVERLLSTSRWTETRIKEFPQERSVFAEPPRIGVFVCSCGINIGSVVDVPAVTEHAHGLPGVVFAQHNLFSCSQDTINQMAKTIRTQGLNRVVVASCSPRTHEPLFQATLREAGINKYLFEMANIRDQDSWVHRDAPEAATEKAKDLVRMAVARVRGKNALSYNSIPVTKSALVVGGGVAGMTTALSLTDQGFPVILVERSGALGGNARAVYRTWQGREVQPYVCELIQKVEDHPGIDLRLGTTVHTVGGSVGRFKTALSDGSEITHGVAILAVGGRPYRPLGGSWNYLYGKDPRVQTLLDVDRRITDDPDSLKQLSQAVFIHCVGSRIPERPYCSRVCCTHAIDLALKLKEINPEIDIFMLYRDIRTYGQRERIYQEAREKGVIFMRYGLESRPGVALEGGQIIVEANDHVLARRVKLHPDLLVLASAVIPESDSRGLSKLFKCAMNAEGFFLEAHAKLKPVDFATEGVYLAGLCHYPKPIDESIAQAKAAAARAVTVLSQDAVPVESITAAVNSGKCTGCGVCAEICPYHAISLDPVSARAVVEASLCKGCGACVAGCRSDAVTLKNVGNEEIISAIEAAMEAW
jgi:heterodisulfide reductase subunit A